MKPDPRSYRIESLAAHGAAVGAQIEDLQHQLMHLKKERVATLRELRQLHLTYREIGELTGISGVRAYQLVTGRGDD